MDFISVMNYFLQTHSETHSYKFSFKNDDYIDWNQVSEEIKVNLYRIIKRLPITLLSMLIPMKYP